jgi:AraC-like DNA-binding protein
MEQAEARNVHEQVELSLYQVETAAYEKLGIEGMNRPHWIISHVLRGSVETETEGHIMPVRAGDVMIHPPGVPFCERAPGPGCHQWFELEMKVSPSAEVLRLYPVAYVVKLSSPSEFSIVFQKLEAAFTGPPSHTRDLRIVGLTADLIDRILESWRGAGSPPRPDAKAAPDDRFRPVMSYMREHLDEKLSRTKLARRAGLHPAYFDRLFRAAYGTPPMQLLRDLRLRRAQSLLEDSDQTLEEIARATGLGDAAYLSRVFRAKYGKSPGQHRESTRNTKKSYILAGK